MHSFSASDDRRAQPRPPLSVIAPVAFSRIERASSVALLWPRGRPLGLPETPFWKRLPRGGSRVSAVEFSVRGRVVRWIQSRRSCVQGSFVARAFDQDGPLMLLRMTDYVSTIELQG